MNSKRLGIFLFWDSDGIVDDYILYLLDDMMNNLTDLVIVVNGSLNDNGRKKFEKYTSRIFVRANVGFDIGGLQDALVNYCGFDKIREYDELVLFNDSFFGPVYPFSKVFEAIDDSIDFWGLSVHGEAPNVYGMCPYGYRPRYLQTYFLVIRNEMLKSEAFEKFWVNLPVFKEFKEVGEKFSCVFTKYFADMGYKWCAYSDTGDLETTREKAMSYHTFNTFDMVANRKFPILKRKTFVTEKTLCLNYNYADELARAVEYVRDNTGYDVGLIYKYLLRKYNLADLKRSLNWSLVLPAENRIQEKLYKDKKIAVIAHMYYPELFEYTLSYLKNVPEEADIWATTESEKKKQRILELFRPVLGDRFNVIVVNPRGRDLSALLVGSKKLLMKYDYLCFVHDKKSAQKEYSTVGSTFSDLLWENMLKSKGYIHNILNEFEKDKSLGLLVPPNVYHGTYFCSALDYWTICYDKTLDIANILGLNADISRDKPPVSVGTVFWCRTAALKSVFENKFDYSDFPGEPLPVDGSFSHALERIFPYVAQHHGFYTKTVMNCGYSQAEIENYRYMLGTLLNRIKGTPNVDFRNFHRLTRTVETAKQDYAERVRNGNIMAAPVDAEAKEVIKEVVVDIGVKGALKNYFKKKFKRRTKEKNGNEE